MSCQDNIKFLEVVDIFWICLQLCKDAMTSGGIVGNILTFIKGGIQKDLWHLIAASTFLHNTDGPITDCVGRSCKEGSCYGLRTCVQSFYALTAGNMN